MIWTTIILCLTISFSKAYAKDDDWLQGDMFIERIEIVGNHRTKPEIVLREIGFSEGEKITQDQIESAIQQLKNMRLFSTVSYVLKDSILTIEVEERWTTIPIVKFSSGGGATELVLGLYDINLFGMYFEAGMQYQRLGETNSGVVWTKTPLWFDHRYSINLQAWNTKRVRTKYVQQKIEPEILKGFLHSRKKYIIEMDRNVFPWLDAGLFFEHHEDDFSLDYLNDKVRTIAEKTGLPPNTTSQTIGIRIKAGRVNYDGFLLDGTAAEYTFKRVSVTGQTKDVFSDHGLSLTSFHSVFGNKTLAARLQLGRNNTRVLQYWYYLGGLDKIRGFSDNRFAGNRFWLINLESRFPILTRDIFVLQSVFFHDTVAAGDRTKDLLQASGSAIGAGLRFIMPKVYRLVARLDYAVPIVKKDNQSISFGVQQFF